MTLVVFGSVNMDVVARVDRLPRPGETVAAGSLHHLPGGKGANQAVAAARFGHPTRLIAAVGGDEHGDRLIAFLAGEGIDLAGLRRVAGGTGVALIHVARDGENQIVVVAGANATLACPDDPGGGAAATFLAQLEAPLDAVADFLRAGRSLGARTILNAAPALADARPLLGLADILIVNETELAFFCGVEPRQDAGAVTTLARSLIEREDQWVIVTLGAAGVVAVCRAEALHRGARRARVVDTTGAGDTFCGVLAVCLGEGVQMAEALGIAGAAASLSVEREGAAASMPRREEVLALLAPAG